MATTKKATNTPTFTPPKEIKFITPHDRKIKEGGIVYMLTQDYTITGLGKHPANETTFHECNDGLFWVRVAASTKHYRVGSLIIDKIKPILKLL